MPMVVLTSLAVGSRAQLKSNASGLPGLRVGDYTDQLSNGKSLPLYTLIWRAIGRPFFDPNIVNQTFATDANTAFLEARHSMTYTVANINWSVFIINTSRSLNGNIGGQPVGMQHLIFLYLLQVQSASAGCAVEEWVTDSALVEYSSVDLLMRTTLHQDSVWEDLGVTEDSHRAKVAQNLADQGWNMVS